MVQRGYEKKFLQEKPSQRKLRGITVVALGRCVLRPWHLVSLGTLVKRQNIFRAMARHIAVFLVYIAYITVVCHTVHGANDTPAASQDDGGVAPPPWAKKLESRFDALQTSVQKISAEERLLEHVEGLQHALKPSNRVAKAVQARSALTRTWLSGGVVAANANSGHGSQVPPQSLQLQSNAACPSIATGHDTVYLEPRAWTWGYTVDVLVPDGKGGKQVVGTVHSTPFAFDRNMTLTNTEGQMVSSSKKYFFTTVRDTYYTIKGT
jgi:hypothetical protein